MKAPVRTIRRIALATLLLGVSGIHGAGTGAAGSSNAPAAGQSVVNGQATPKLTVTVGKSLIIDSPLNIQRISVANGDLVEAVAVNPKEVLINGKAPGETTLIVWQESGTRLVYELNVRLNQSKIENTRAQIAREFPESDISVTWENDNAFVRGTVKDVISAERVMAIAGTLGKNNVNLLRVSLPPPETQILLKVRFANVDRGVDSDLGVNLASTAFNQSTSVSTGQFGSARVDEKGLFTLGDALNVFLFRRDINLGATIKALQAKRLLEILAEPNVLAINGKQASFVAGGEFPFPTLQGGAGVGAVTIQFREFGVRINFLPVVTPRGTIRLQVAPEVSSLDFANGVTFQGFTIPALATRRIQTEIELETGQSFLIAGLLDNRMTETLNKIPGLGDVPLLGKLFQSKSISRKNSELLVMVTPEIVRPVPAGQAPPELQFSEKFLEPNSQHPRHPGMDKTGPVPVVSSVTDVPVEQLTQELKKGQAQPAASAPQFQLVPVQSGPVSVNPGLAPTTPLPAGGPGK